MKYLHSWLQDYIDGKLPEPKEVARVLSLKALDVEEIKSVENDTMYEVKVLPHRAHDVMSHRGLARELAALFGYGRNQIAMPQIQERDYEVAVHVSDATLCRRYMAVAVENITVGPSPNWIVKRLEALGHRSISNIVDITNFVMHDMGQPMHVFDKDKVKGAITIRIAEKGETMTMLDGKDIILFGTETVIADVEGVLALAGVKGGTKAIVDEKTTSIIFESANFNPIITRNTAALHNIRTDSGKRFEQGITSDFAEEGLREALAIVLEGNKDASIGKVTDVYPKKEIPYKVGVSEKEINSLLGSGYLSKEIEGAFQRLMFSYEEVVPEEVFRGLSETVMGKSYMYGASVRTDAPNAFDCSSLMAWLYSRAGIRLPRVSIDQYVYGYEVQDLVFGDLIFANTKQGNIHTTTVDYMAGKEVKEGIDHVGMYIGEGKVLHATKAEGKVVVEPITESASFKNIIGYRRISPSLKEKRYVVTVPNERLDIRIKEDLIEEVGRIMGYDILPSAVPGLSRKGLPHKRMYYEIKIKNILLESGFSEIYTYTFGDVGEVSILKGMASDKEKLRTNLSQGLHDALLMNLKNAPLLSLSVVKVFEFGNIFTDEGERRHLALAIDDGKKKTSFTEEVDLILAHIKKELGLSSLEYTTSFAKPYVIELDFDTMIEALPEPTYYEGLNESFSQASRLLSYKPISPYPFIVRDIAVWTPASTTWEDIHGIALQINDSRIVRIDCFDTFSKEIEGKGMMTSYAFRFVIQSNEKTLTDEEANEIAEKMYSLLKGKGYEIR